MARGPEAATCELGAGAASELDRLWEQAAVLDPPPDWTLELEAGGRAWGVREKGELAGLALVRAWGRTAVVPALLVRPESRGRGLGRRLVGRLREDLLRRDARTCGLESDPADGATLAALARCGFKPLHLAWELVLPVHDADSAASAEGGGTASGGAGSEAEPDLRGEAAGQRAASDVEELTEGRGDAEPGADRERDVEDRGPSQAGAGGGPAGATEDDAGPGGAEGGGAARDDERPAAPAAELPEGIVRLDGAAPVGDTGAARLAAALDASFEPEDWIRARLREGDELLLAGAGDGRPAGLALAGARGDSLRCPLLLVDESAPMPSLGPLVEALRAVARERGCRRLALAAPSRYWDAFRALLRLGLTPGRCRLRATLEGFPENADLGRALLADWR